MAAYAGYRAYIGKRPKDERTEEQNGNEKNQKKKGGARTMLKIGVKVVGEAEEEEEDDCLRWRVQRSRRRSGEEG
jgi:hypothetical protein